MSRQGGGRRVGRKAIKIDWSTVSTMANNFCPVGDIAKVVKVDPDTLRIACRREHKMSLHDFVHQAQAGRRANLRQAQFALAIEGKCKTMQIWLGKQHLGQMDRLEKLDKEWARRQDRAELVRLAKQAMQVLEKSVKGKSS